MPPPQSNITEIISTGPADYLARVTNVLTAPRPFTFALRLYGRTNAGAIIRVETILTPEDSTARITWLDRKGQANRSTAPFEQAATKLAATLELAIADADQGLPIPAPKQPTTTRNPPPPAPAPSSRGKPTKIGETRSLF